VRCWRAVYGVSALGAREGFLARDGRNNPVAASFGDEKDEKSLVASAFAVFVAAGANPTSATQDPAAPVIRDKALDTVADIGVGSTAGDGIGVAAPVRSDKEVDAVFSDGRAYIDGADKTIVALAVVEAGATEAGQVEQRPSQTIGVPCREPQTTRQVAKVNGHAAVRIEGIAAHTNAIDPPGQDLEIDPSSRTSDVIEDTSIAQFTGALHIEFFAKGQRDPGQNFSTPVHGNRQAPAARAPAWGGKLSLCGDGVKGRVKPS